MTSAMSVRTVLFAAVALAATAGFQAKADELSRIAAAVASAGHAVPPLASLRDACDDDALCAARFLRDRIGEGAELVPD